MNRNWEEIAYDYVWSINSHMGRQSWQGLDPVRMYDNKQWHDLAAWAHGESVTSPNELIQLLVRKHLDYGAHNFDRHGAEGIRVRIWDKLTRISNLKDRDPENESLNDSYDDIVGYVVLMWMVDAGEMQTPMNLTEITTAGIFQVHMVTGDGTVLYRKLNEPARTTGPGSETASRLTGSKQPEESGRLSPVQAHRWETP